MPKGKRIEPLDIEELEKNPSLNGMLAFREPASASLPPTPLTPIGTKPPPGIEDPQLADVLAQLAATRIPKSTGKTVRAVTVEDGHSATQNALYWFLWRAGQHVNGSRSRFVQAGYGQIQRSLGIDRSNVQDAVRELQKKLSIEVRKPSTVGSATVYEVFCCEEILSARKRKGLLWARRFGTRRADLLAEPGEELAAPIGTAPTGPDPIDMNPVGLMPSEGLTPTEPVGLSPTGGIGVTPIHSVSREVISNQASTTLAAIVRAIKDELGLVDDTATRRIIDNCRQRVPDATDEEIEYHVREQAGRARRLKRLENPVGFLITQVPRCFEGESFRQFREARLERERRGREGELAEENRRQGEAAELLARLDDPRIGVEEKNLIRRILA